MDESLTQDMPTPTSTEFRHEEPQQQKQHMTKEEEGVVEPRTPSASSRNTSQESLRTPTKSTPGSSDTPLRPSKRLPSSPTSTPARPSWEGHRRSLSAVPETIREKSPASLLTLSDYDGSEASHTERRFLRLYEELDSHCLEEPFPEFITPWFLRRINYGPCKAGDIVDLLRFLRPGGLWISPFEGRSMLDPFLAASLEKALYPDVDNFNPGQKALLQSLHHFVFSAYAHAQGIFFPFDKEWEADRREVPVDALNSYVEDIVALIEYTRQHGRETSLRDFVRDRTQGLNNADRKRTFLFGEGGDTRSETEEYVYNLFLGLLGLWTVGIDTSDMVDLTFHQGAESKKIRFDCSKNLPHKETMMGDISLIRETFGCLATPLDGNGGMEWIRPLQDFDASTIVQGPFHFALTRDISRHITLDEKSRAITLFCEEAMSEEDSLSRLEGNMIAKTLNLDCLEREHKLLHALLFSSDESRQIAFSLGLRPPPKGNVFLRLSAFPNYAPHLLSIRKDTRNWRPRRFKELFLKGSQTHRYLTWTIITILILLFLLFILAITGTIGIWIIFRHIIIIIS